MSFANVTPQEILDAIERLPAERWSDVLYMIESLQRSPASAAPGSSPVRTGTDLRGSDLIGIWADRSDIANGHQFARGLRLQAEQRDRQGPSDAAAGY
jgi:hypothetical protein